MDCGCPCSPLPCCAPHYSVVNPIIHALDDPPSSTLPTTLPCSLPSCHPHRQRLQHPPSSPGTPWHLPQALGVPRQWSGLFLCTERGQEGECSKGCPRTECSGWAGCRARWGYSKACREVLWELQMGMCGVALEVQWETALCSTRTRRVGLRVQPGAWGWKG